LKKKVKMPKVAQEPFKKIVLKFSPGQPIQKQHPKDSALVLL
jgi:hypothetical protein